MANILKIRKVNSLPGVLEASTLYFLVDGSNVLNVSLTNSLGTVVYNSYNSSNISSIVLAIINGLKNTANGILGLNSTATIDPSFINKLNGSSLDTRPASASILNSIYVDLYISTASATLTNNVSLHGLTFSGTTNQFVFLQFFIPFDYTLSTNLRIRLHCHTTTARTAGQTLNFILLSSFIQHFNNQTTVSEVTTNYNNTLSTGGSNSCFYIDLVVTPTANCAPGGLFISKLTRDAAGDSNNGVLVIGSVQLIYETSRLGTLTNTPPF
jgi:hypothetical protein